MKRWLHVLLILVMTLSLAGCGSTQNRTAAEAQTGETVEVQQGGTDTSVEEFVEEDTGDGTEAEDFAEADTGDDTKAEDEGMEATDLTGESEEEAESETMLPEDGVYTSKEDVALYIYLYGCLPSNFITKKDAQALGWEGGSLEPYAPGKCIGGSRFGNYEGLLPEKEGRVYTECDIDTLGADRRGAKRIVFSNDGLIYYTEDHYESFELLYGEE